MRDGHLSLFAAKTCTEDVIPIAPAMDKADFWFVEVSGGATFDAMTRFLNETAGKGIRILKELMPNTPLQVLLRSQNLAGYRESMPTMLLPLLSIMVLIVALMFSASLMLSMTNVV